jgi:enoyl-[acyl-carrier protein] reductase I
MFTLIDQVAPLHRNIEQGDVGDLATLLCLPIMSNLTGNIVYLDSGFHLMGLGTM